MSQRSSIVSKKIIAVISRINGQNALGIDIKKQSDANAVEMSKLVRLDDWINSLRNIKTLILQFHIASDMSEVTLWRPPTL